MQYAVLLISNPIKLKFLSELFLFSDPSHSHLTTRMDGDILSSHPDSPELLMKAAVGGVKLRGEARRCAGNEEGAEICDGKSGAGVTTGTDVTEETEVVGRVGEKTTMLHVSSLDQQRKKTPILL